MTDNIYWNEQGQPISHHFDDIYFSTENGLAETDYVFLQQNHLSQRFAELHAGDTYTVAETGFGTGLNFLACCALWSKIAPTNAQLHFISTEKYPLSKYALSQAAKLWPSLQSFTKQLVDVYPDNIPQNTVTLSDETADFYRLHINDSINLTLLIGDAATGLEQLLARTLAAPNSATHSQVEGYWQESRQWQGVDTWFLDGFAPAKNPDMWTEKLFTTMAKLSHSGSRFSTFTAAGVVKRGLSTAGFSIEKVAGFGKKREMLIGKYSGHTGGDTSIITEKKVDESPKDIITTNTSANKKNTSKIIHPLSTWALINQYQPTPKQKTIAVIGGGLAGCHTAHALAKKGYCVTLFEQAEQLACGASGNAQGIVYGKLSASSDPLGEINRYSLRYAQSFYQSYWQQAEKKMHGEACGVLQLSLSEKMSQTHQLIASDVINDTESLRYVSAKEASHIANTRIDHPALYFPKLGWVNPPALCQWLIKDSRITLVSNTHITALQKEDHWILHGVTKDEKLKAQNFSTSFDTVVITTAYDATQFIQTNTLPIKKIRGQVSHYPITTESAKLQTVVCGKGYIAPSISQSNNGNDESSDKSSMHCLGASFNLHSTNTELTTKDHQDNMVNIALQVPDIVQTESASGEHSTIADFDGRVSFRCVTPDYLPIVGAAPVLDKIQDCYAALRKNGRQTINQAGDYYPGLYINIGFGSRGLAYAPLCSEILANLIDGSPPPIPQYLVQKLNPARFTIRELIRSPR